MTSPYKGSFAGLNKSIYTNIGTFYESSKDPLKEPFTGFRSLGFISGSFNGSSRGYVLSSIHQRLFSFLVQVTGSSPQVPLQDSSKVSLLV